MSEVGQYKNFVRIISEFWNGVFLIEITGSFKELETFFKLSPPIFIRHVCPFQFKVDLAGQKDKQQLFAVLAELTRLLSKEKSFSIQLRGDKSSELRGFLQDYLVGKGFVLQIKNPVQIVSGIVKNEELYLGVSLASENLSSWAGGACHFAVEKEQISRAEFKLLELMDLGILQLPTQGNVLDIGAAPGGWSRILAQKGLQVVAVDPANLDSRLIENENIVHYKEIIQEYLAVEKKSCFEVILNDMKMEAIESAYIMREAADLLTENSGVAVMTLKLPHIKVKQKIGKVKKILASEYRIIGMRNLFHNRQEVTAVLQKY
ncbi:methyltransferase domain-containing protein [bacterium]|nr:methyltransferase domain-containing protein [bacterium]MBT3581350.1 methyltransferase domain-containing protein [bacterium]MBT4552083.1 methyltransferase domain-containing protein [bacterium]MBT5988116.1 methyltransferase domain-containing protein [bacterium]MBT7088241.1 methyltransferase domain-containing protein [bacterium]